MDVLDRLPRDRVFTWQEAAAAGVRSPRLRELVATGLLIRLAKGLYAVAGLPLTVERRARALALVLPPSAVATDETAAWLHGVDLFRGLDADGLPYLSFFQAGAHDRLRNRAVSSGSRQLEPQDVRVVHGVPVTTPLRTALDLARLRRADRAIGALDGLLRLGEFSRQDLLDELGRFKGYRGVVQARALVPLASPLSESPAESKLRYEWMVSGVQPKPEPQILVDNPFGGPPWALDLGVRRLRYGVEYDGKDFHATPEQRERDRRKRDHLRDEEGWVIDVFTREHLYTPGADPMQAIAAGLRRCLRASSRPAKEWRWPA